MDQNLTFSLYLKEFQTAFSPKVKSIEIQTETRQGILKRAVNTSFEVTFISFKTTSMTSSWIQMNAPVDLSMKVLDVLQFIIAVVFNPFFSGQTATGHTKDQNRFRKHK